MRRITGHADREPAVVSNPMAIRNNRLEIIFLRSDQMTEIERILSVSALLNGEVLHLYLNFSWYSRKAYP